MTALIVIGRILFGGYFIYSGISHFKESKAFTAYAQSKGVPQPSFAVLISGVLLIVGGAGFFLNLFIQQSAIFLLIFLIPGTLMMHAFWKEKDPMARMGDRVNFFKNVALIGALLMML